MSLNEASVNDGNAPSGTVKPQSLVTEDNVRAALITDKGANAGFISWKVVDFTKKGDNSGCAVSSVEVKYELDGQRSDVVYVVKLNPCRNDVMEFMNVIFFEKEAKFYCSLVPVLNAVLKDIGQRKINFPNCLHVDLEKGKEIIFLEDLRPQGYKMHDERRIMDTFHTNLVLRELARLHAASFLLEKKCAGEDLRKEYPFLKKNISELLVESRELLNFLRDCLTFAQEVLRVVGRYERAVAWIDTLIPKLVDITYEHLECGKPKVVCHGDCWNNNLLFKYDDSGHPEEVMILDMQVVRYTPPTTDLSYFLYTATMGDFRKSNLQAFLGCYHDALTDIMKAAGQEAPFKLEQLIKDFRETIRFGAIFGIMSATLSILGFADEMVSSNDTDETIEDMLRRTRANAIETIDSNPMLRSKLLPLIDEIMESGLIT